MSKIAVTGGAGFIGSHVVDMLIAENHEVIVIDDLSHGKKENINPQAKFYEVNICDPYLREVLGKEGPDAVIHQAAQISVKKSIMNPRFDAHTNIIGSISLLESCKDLCIDRVVYSSSVAVYGEPEYLPIDEKHPIKPMSPYGASKHSVEDYLYYYCKNHDTKCVSLRYGNVYGPRQDPEGEAGVIAVFINNLLGGEKSTINGDGGHTRDFVYVEDVARANLLALSKADGCKAYNIGTGVETTIEQLYNELKQITKTDSFPVYSDPLPGDIRKSYIDPQKALNGLGWKPKNSLSEGLKKTVNWMRKNK